MKLKNFLGTRKFLKKAGQIPGHISVNETTDSHTTIELFSYTHDDFKESAIETIQAQDLLPDHNNWIKVVGLKDYKAIKEMGATFNIHPLILEDVMNTDHLPKVEFSQHHLFFTLKLPIFEEGELVELKHVSLIVGANYLITLQEGTIDNLSVMSDRIRDAAGRLREKGVMYLFYSIIDFIVDQYFQLMESLRDQIELTEDTIIDSPGKNHIDGIQEIKKKLVLFRKFVTSSKSAVYKLINVDNKFIDRPLRLFFNDVYDHIVHLNEQMDTFKEYQTTLLEMNMANISNSMNKVMKTLTVVAAIFIPLTFLAGIYGMNFTNMPELTWEYGYPAIMTIMLVIALVMLFIMKRKEWF
jgi:magnesium transporter